MEIVVTRVDSHRYSTMVEREGVRLRVPGYAFMRALPHDLAHFVVEHTLRLDRGFWGSIASGAEFRGMERIDGRRKPHATEIAKTMSRQNADYIGEAERLVACFERIVDGNFDRIPQRAETELRQALATVRHQSKPITALGIANVCAAWRVIQARWNVLEVGDAIRLEWASVRSGKRHH